MYNGRYGEYSPYYQQNPGQVDQGQHDQQSRDPGTSAPVSYRQPSLHGSNPGYNLPSTSNAQTFYGFQGYISNNSLQDSSAENNRAAYPHGPSLVDATSLGNLAYASSLESQGNHASNSSSHTRNPSTEQASHHGRRGDPVNGNSWQDKIQDKPSSLPPYTIFQPVSTNPSANARSPYTPLQERDRLQQSILTTEDHYYPHNQRIPYQFSKPEPRPINGQETNRPASRVSQTNRLTSSREASANRASSDTQETGSVSSLPPSASQSQQKYIHPAPPVQTPSSANPSPVPPLLQPPKYKPSPQPPQSQTLASASSRRLPEVLYVPQNQSKTSHESSQHGPTQVQPAQLNMRPSHELSPRPEDQLLTVDPNRVLNQAEYQKCQAQEAAKEKALIILQKNQDSLGSSSVNGALQGKEPVARTSDETREAQISTAAGSAESDTVKKEQMELEMKQMLDRMREYKANDPSLFSQIWEQVKKGQGSVSASPIITQPQIPSPSEQASPLERGLNESNFPPSFDRGRFPFQRRRRGALKPTFTRPDATKVEPKKHANTFDDPQTGGSTSSRFPPTQTADSTGLDSTDRRLLSAMDTFRRSVDGNKTESSGRRASSVANKHVTQGPACRPDLTVQAETNSPVKSSIGRTVWPEHKKESMAAVAAKTLNERYSKDGRTIGAAEIHSLLDQNPSYIQMCEHLERRGFFLDRAQFAKLLLSSVPDLASSNPVPSPSNGRAVFAAPVAPMVPTKPAVGRPDRHQHSESIDSNSLNGQNNLLSSPRTSFPPSKSVVDRGIQSSKLMRLELQHVTKEEKARKRNLSDLIDLSQEHSDEEEGRFRPQAKVDRGPQRIPDGPASVGMEGEKTSRRFHDFQSRVGPREHIRAETVAEPLNKRRDALRRSTYDPGTIARDILISLGRHPNMAPLNHHLEVLRERFPSVNLESDLSTLRWDIIDPGAPASAEKPHPIVSNQASPLHTPRPAMPSNTPKRRGCPPKFLVSSETPPKEASVTLPPPSATLSTSPNIVINHKKTIDSSLIPMEFSRVEVPSSSDSNPPPKDPATTDEGMAFIQRFAFNPTEVCSVPPQKTSSANDSAGFTPITSSAPSDLRVPGRRGRPPGAKNKQPRSDKGVPKSRLSILNDKGNSASTYDATRFPTEMSANLANASTPRRLSIVVPSRSPSVAANGKSLAPARRDSIPKEKMNTNNHQTISAFGLYKCRWDGCPAELHNIDTLRKHIHKHRTHLEKPYQCKWAGCGAQQDAIIVAESQRVRFKFEEAKVWDEHLENEHIRPLTMGTPRRALASFQAVSIPLQYT